MGRLRLRRGLGAAAVVLGVALGSAAPAGASPETLKRAVGNILFGPFDIACAPIMGSRTVYRNIQDIDDSMWVRVAYVLPGFGWNTVLTIGSGIIRTMAGIIELVPGIGLVPFETDLDAIFSPVEKSDALVDVETPVLNFKFCMDYVD